MCNNNVVKANEIHSIFQSDGQYNVCVFPSENTSQSWMEIS